MSWGRARPLHIGLVLGQRELWLYLLVSGISLLSSSLWAKWKKASLCGWELWNVMLGQHRWQCSDRTRTVIAPVTDHSSVVTAKKLLFWIYKHLSVRRYELKKLLGKPVSKQQIFNVHSFQKCCKLKWSCNSVASYTGCKSCSTNQANAGTQVIYCIPGASFIKGINQQLNIITSSPQTNHTVLWDPRCCNLL